MREDEGISYIYSIKKCVVGLQLIGQIRNDGLKKKGLKIIGHMKGKLTFQYYDGSSWQTVEHCFIDLDDTYRRMPFSERHCEILSKSRVVIFGVGSGGSGLADRLARAGVGNFDLIDPDRLSVENISRHLCDLTDLGRCKVKAVRDRILLINPNAGVRTYAYDVFKRPNALEQIISSANLIIGATDDAPTQLRINWFSAKRSIPALFPSCYELARGGEILYTIGRKTNICLECWMGRDDKPEVKGKMDYSTAQSLRDYKGEPALYAAISFITDIAAQYAIALLLRKEDCELARLIDLKNNLLLIGGALGKDYFFFKKPFHFITPIIKGPWKECTTCQVFRALDAEASARHKKK